MHDLIVEWVLRANGARSWRFERKIADYKRMKADGSLLEPHVLASWRLGSQAFWELYKCLTPFRNQLVHGGGFSVSERTLDIVHRDGGRLSLSNEEQGSYIRAICLIADAIMRDAAIETVNLHRVESDFYMLRQVHGIVGLNPRALRIAAVRVTAQGDAAADGRISVDINFDDIQVEAERSFPSEGNILAYDLTVSAEGGGRQVKWIFPPLVAPTGERRLAEGDPAFEPYLIVG
jgi:hypothetical protein